VINGVKSCTEVEEEENGEGARIRGEEEVVGDFEQSGFGAVVSSEAGLEYFIHAVGVEVLLELYCDGTFQYF